VLVEELIGRQLVSASNTTIEMLANFFRSLRYFEINESEPKEFPTFTSLAKDQHSNLLIIDWLSISIQQINCCNDLNKAIFYWQLKFFYQILAGEDKRLFSQTKFALINVTIALSEFSGVL
jgi:hypothetical protein